MRAFENELITHEKCENIVCSAVCMERYFLGNNSGYGFFNLYEKELKLKDKVVLLKGGSGTGKSSLLKKIAKKAKSLGLDYELWFCSGDPQSLDGVFVKDKNVAVVDATSPHASGVDIPVVKDVIFDLAQNIDKDKLKGMREEIEKRIKTKKQHFMRAYQHLKSALCHLYNQFEIEKQGVEEDKIRAYASSIARDLKPSASVNRELFSRAICPSGESEYFDHLRGKRVIFVSGCAYAKKVFFEEISKLRKGLTLLLSPLDPKTLEGIICDDVAYVQEVGHFAKDSIVDLGVFGEKFDKDDEIEESNNKVLQTAFAVERLNKAREAHMSVENIFVPAMNFDGNEKMLKEIESFVFE